MQQHAESVGGPQIAGAGRLEQRGHERHVDEIGDDGVGGKQPDVEVEMSPKETTRIVLMRDAEKRLAADSQLRAAVNLLKLSRQ